MKEKYIRRILWSDTVLLRVGKAVTDNSELYTLADTPVFLEFLPICDDKCEALLPDELEVGKRYNVLVTNNAELYRYQLGDVIEVVEMKDGKPGFRLAYRSAQKIVIGEAEITEDEVYIPDVNEKNIPHGKALDMDSLEEERRLFYVALTRARNKLFVGCVNNEDERVKPSFFVEELT